MPHLIGREFLDTAFIVCCSGIDNEHVDLAMLLLYGTEALSDLLFIRRVAPGKISAHVTGNLHATVAASGYGYGGTVVDEIPGYCQSDATRATGYQCDFSF
jgi:hypothetical protein